LYPLGSPHSFSGWPERARSLHGTY
jgi:hypothetical protein